MVEKETLNVWSQEGSSDHPYLMEQQWEPMSKRVWDDSVTVGHSCQHGHMISLCSHWELSQKVEGYHFLIGMRQYFLMSSFFPPQGKGSVHVTTILSPFQLPERKLRHPGTTNQQYGCKDLHSGLLGLPIWKKKRHRHLLAILVCPVLPHSFSFSHPCTEEYHR